MAKAKRVKKISLPTRVYSYGCRIEDESKQTCFDQLFKMHVYKNKLIEIERKKRVQVRELIRTLSTPLADAMDEEDKLVELMDVIKEEIDGYRIKARAKISDEESSNEFVKTKKRLAEVRKIIKELKTPVFDSEEFKTKDLPIEEEKNKAVKEARANNGLYWGTYVIAEKDLKNIIAGPPPKFQRYDGCGNLGVQIQSGAHVSDIEYGGKHTLIQIDTAPDKQGLRNPWRKARIRVGSEKGKPVWAELKFKMHRPIPADCRFNWVRLHANRIGTHTKWTLQFTLERQEWHKKHLPGNGNVAVDVGWRVMPEGLRVAYWVGEDGQEGQLIIPKDRIKRYRKIPDLSSIEDKKFDAIKDVLMDWKKKNQLPEWLAEKLTYLHVMKSQGKLARIIKEWRENRFAGDSGIYEILENWRRGDKHLVDWEGWQRVGEQQWRKNFYRDFSSMLSQKYRRVILESTNWGVFGRDVPPENTTKEYKPKDFYRRLAAVSILNDSLKQSMAEFVKADPRATTQECSKCHTNNDFDAAKELVHTCCNCGETWDQDRNACLNLLARG